LPEAEFRNGRLNGRCVLTCADGAWLDGRCVNNERNRFGKDYRNDDMNGHGVFIWMDGALWRVVLRRHIDRAELAGWR
jgi:hypothetical protein